MHSSAAQLLMALPGPLPDMLACGAQVCGGYALSLFRHEELELLVCGLPHLDFEALQRAARYEAGDHAQHPTVQALWRVIHSLTLEQKKHFLFFTTGCDR